MQAGLPAGWEGILRAQDDSITTDVPGQLTRLPASSALIVSVGGNDALGAMPLLERPARTVADGLHTLADLHDQFHANYQRMVRAVLQQACPTALCTMYYPRFPERQACNDWR